MKIEVQQMATGAVLAVLDEVNMLFGIPSAGDYIALDNHGSIVHHVIWDYRDYSPKMGIPAKVTIIVE